MFKGNNPFDPQFRIIYATWANSGGREWERYEFLETLDRVAPQYGNWSSVLKMWYEGRPFMWKDYATVVKDLYERRGLCNSLQDGLTRLEDPEDPLISIVSDLENSLVAAVSTSAQEGPSTSEGFSRIRERAANPGSFVRTGMWKLDRIMGPLRPGMVVVVGARPSVGKSIFATNIMAGFGRQGVRAGMFTIEMGVEDQLARMIGAETRTHVGRVDQLSLVPGPVHDAMLVQEEWPLLWNETPGLWLSELRSTVKRWKQRFPDLRVIAIDYLQLVHESGRSREEEIRKISVAVKELCKEEGLVAA
jgi:replicative DNA helicase